ncbi:MAG TPA: DEAD/DEAH box helicase [Thermomicrobiales bacterium]|nr:DEAD/DEAH box helicase [Thermomicrobiales bacterium]
MSEAEIKPKRRARKTVTPEEEAAQILVNNGLATDAVADEAPVKKPRASKKKDADVIAEAPVETEKPKRTRAKKATPETEPEIAEVIEQPVVEMEEMVIEVEEPVVVLEAFDDADEIAVEESDDEQEDLPAAAAPRRESRNDDSLTFSDLGLSDAILKSVKDVGYEEPTPIQAITIPAMMHGGDLIAQAQTGSGKTAAFGFPIIDTVNGRDRSVQALILTPTRELAIQVAEALHKYGKHKGIETLPIYGGQPYERQFRGLQRGPQIVVGTPGRVMDHMRRGTLSLEKLEFFVLDEADEMLDMGFIEDIEWILEQVPDDKRIALFSATMPPRIIQLASTHMNNPEKLIIPGKQMTVPATRQSYYEIPRSRKTDALTRILDAESPQLALIFARTKLGVDELGEALLARGFAAETLHGDLSQAQRDRVMRRFRTGQADILIATDVAARGIDVPDITHVFNYDVPESAETYVHRIGRTGRAGKRGDAITLVTPKEIRWLRQIERMTRAKIEARRLPTLADVAERRKDTLKLEVLEALKDEAAYAQYTQAINDLAEDNEATEIAAAVLKLYADETGRGLASESTEDDLAALTQAAVSRQDRSERGGRDRDGGRERGGGRDGGRFERGQEPGMTRLFLNIGRNFNVRPQDIVGAIANEAGIPGRTIGAIDILDTYSFVDIPSQYVDQVIDAVTSSGIKGRNVNAERAQPGAGRRDRDQGGFRGGGDRGGYRGGDRGPRPQGGGTYGGGQRGGGGNYANRRDSGPGGYQRGNTGNRRSDGNSWDYNRGNAGTPGNTGNYGNRRDDYVDRTPRSDRFDRNLSRDDD